MALYQLSGLSLQDIFMAPVSLPTDDALVVRCVEDFINVSSNNCWFYGSCGTHAEACSGSLLRGTT